MPILRNLLASFFVLSSFHVVCNHARLQLNGSTRTDQAASKYNSPMMRDEIAFRVRPSELSSYVES
jgi:hypothetical protein